MRASAATAVAVTSSPAARARMPGSDLPAAGGLLRFAFPALRRRDTAPEPEPAPAAGPGSIKEAIVHWLDEQL